MPGQAGRRTWGVHDFMKETERRATVQGRSGTRFGRGFSREELKKAGCLSAQIMKLGFRVDSKRRTVHEDNVEMIKKLIKERAEPKGSENKS